LLESGRKTVAFEVLERLDALEPPDDARVYVPLVGAEEFEGQGEVEHA
jgi:hypothetical protein